ncbi:MAG: hypothetical protein QXL23_03865 [Candidatus Nitrosocaldus sp.]
MKDKVGRKEEREKERKRLSTPKGRNWVPHPPYPSIRYNTLGVRGSN